MRQISQLIHAGVRVRVIIRVWVRARAGVGVGLWVGLRLRLQTVQHVAFASARTYYDGVRVKPKPVPKAEPGFLV